MNHHFHPLLNQTDVNTALNRNNAEAQRLIVAKTESNGNYAVESIRLKTELEAAKKALKEAQNLVSDWQAAMMAWKDLAQTLRDEIKACPNHEAHRFGKDDKARANKYATVEDKKRVELGLKPRN